MSKARHVAVAVVALALLLVGLWVGVAVAGVPFGGISKGEATTLASHQVQSDSTRQVVGAIPGFFWFFRGGATDAVAPGYTLVWAVTFRGTFRGSCGPPGAQCPPPDHSEMVILDYRSGAFIMASITP
jgi:hypothetical protein